MFGKIPRRCASRDDDLAAIDQQAASGVSFARFDDALFAGDPGMDQMMIADRLNDLLEIETRGLAARLDAVYSFVGPQEADAAALFRKIQADHLNHQRLLTEAIVQVGGVPRPEARDMDSAGDHYVGARRLVQLILDEKRRCIAACERLAGEVPSDGGAGSTVARILKDHRNHLAQLELFASRQQEVVAESATPAQADDA